MREVYGLVYLASKRLSRAVPSSRQAVTKSPELRLPAPDSNLSHHCIHFAVIHHIIPVVLKLQ